MKKIPVGFVLALFFFTLGILTAVCLIGYSFTALVFCGVGGVIVCYQLLVMLAKKHPKPAKIILVILSCCLGIGLIAAVFTGRTVVKASAGQEQDCAYVVVLGAGVNGTVPSLSLKERLDAACDYLTAYPDAVCVVSGGQGSGEDISEAQCMYNELTARGISADRVWMEDQATDTRENIRFSLDLIEERTGTRPEEIGLVSSEYHLYRAGLFARDENVTAYGIPARTSWVTLRVNYYLREIAAVWYYTVLGG